MKYNKDVSVVLGTYNRKRFLKLTIDSVRKELENSNLNYEIIVVDGGSTDGTIKWLTKQKDIISIIQHNRGKWRGKEIERRSWGYFMNLGFKSAQGKYICMISDDCLIVPGAIANGINVAEEAIRKGEKIGAVAFYWRNWPEQKEYVIGLTLGQNMFINHGLYLSDALKAVDYIDEETYQFYCGDGDLCLKIKEKGYSCVEAPDSFIEHFSHANISVRTGNGKLACNDQRAYISRWKNAYPESDLNNTGGWITKQYHDIYNTVKNYRKFSILIPCYLSKIKNKVFLFVRSCIK